ncbi:MAG: deoxyribonuclease IV [Planctomycetota bacterium]|nr:MAG: deoxyribonuclease IV [Planctomycetota bacterium]
MLGSHLSVAGGLVNALHEARRLRFDTVQIFTKNQRQWRVPPLKEDARDDWLRELRELGWEGRTASHASYLANLGSPDRSLWEKSLGLMRAEVERCDALSIPYLVFHPGAHMGASEEDARAGCDRVAQGVRRLIDQTPDGSTVLCLENTAGAGTTLGRTFEELARIAQGAVRGLRGSARSRAEARIGFCFDTCHALAAGYDITTAEGVREVFDRFDRALGLGRLRVLHLNDSKGALGSRVDRHTHIGDGAVGLEAFRHIMNRPEFRLVPKILETPKGESPKGTPWDTINRRRLERLIEPAGAGERPEPRTGAR